MEDVFAADLTHAKPVDYDAWRRRGVRGRLFELLVFPIRDML